VEVIEDLDGLGGGDPVQQCGEFWEADVAPSCVITLLGPPAENDRNVASPQVGFSVAAHM